MPKLEQLEDILGTLEGFTVKENWDRFFTIRGSDNEFEWYAEWADLRGPLRFQPLWSPLRRWV